MEMLKSYLSELCHFVITFLPSPHIAKIVANQVHRDLKLHKSLELIVKVKVKSDLGEISEQ